MNRVQIQYGNTVYTGKLRKLPLGEYGNAYTVGDFSSLTEHGVVNRFGPGLYRFTSGTFNTCWIEIDGNRVYPFSYAIFESDLEKYNHITLTSDEVAKLSDAVTILDNLNMSQESRRMKMLLEQDQWVKNERGRIRNIKKHMSTERG